MVQKSLRTNLGYRKSMYMGYQRYGIRECYQPGIRVVSHDWLNIRLSGTKMFATLLSSSSEHSMHSWKINSICHKQQLLNHAKLSAGSTEYNRNTARPGEYKNPPTPVNRCIPPSFSCPISIASRSTSSFLPFLRSSRSLSMFLSQC